MKVSDGLLTFKIKVGKTAILPKDPFTLESFGQAAQFAYAESRVLGESSSISDAYLRAYLGKIVVYKKHEDGQTSASQLYPTLIVYESGVVILEFRMISPETAISFKDFMDGAVNLPHEVFEKVEVSPGIAINASAAYARSMPSSAVGRLKLLGAESLHRQAVVERTRVDRDGSFAFELVAWTGSADTLRSIATSIFHITSFLIVGLQGGLRYLISGQTSPPDLGAFWSGRPHIHLIEFEGQQPTASQNESKHSALFGRILAKVSFRSGEVRLGIPENLRIFEDYCAYVESTATLWAWSSEGLRAQKSSLDPNRGNYIYERQVLAETLEYGYMLHRALYHRVESLQSTVQVMRVRKNLLRLRLRMREASQSGEVRKLLESGWSKLGLDALAVEIESGLAMRESEMRSRDTNAATQVGWALTLVFGLVAVPGLADQVVIPTWKAEKWFTYLTTDQTKVAAAFASLLSVAILLSLLAVLRNLMRIRGGRERS